MTPRPVSAPAIHDPDLAAEVRRLDCRRYSECLSRAHAEKWDGFACGECSAYEPLTRDEARTDMEGMAKLIAEIPMRNRVRLFLVRH